MRDFVTIICFVCLLAGLGMAERLYHKWKVYVTCTQINLMVAEGRFERTHDFIKSRSDVLHADSIDDAVNVCRDEGS